jgi:hypothetical protein
MRAEVSAYEVAIPLPVIFTIRRGMDADETTAMMDIFLQGFFFFGAENLTGRVEEDEGSILRRIFGRNQVESAVVSTANPFCAPNWRIAAIPVAMLAW